MLRGFALWSLRRTMLFPFSKGVTLAYLKWNQWYWLLTKQDSSFFWWMNTFKNHDLHDKTTEGKTHSCSWSTYRFPHGLKYVSTNVNIMSLHILKLLQICSFVSPSLHICTDYENGNKKYVHSAYIAPFIPFLPLFHLYNTSFSYTIFFSQPFCCLLHVSNNVIFISFTSSKCWFSCDTFRIFLINPFIWLNTRHFTKMLSVTLFIYTIDGLQSSMNW